MSSAYNQVSILPWLKSLNIQIGNVIFWEYDSSSIKDKETVRYLDKYVKCYIDKHLEPIKKVTIASYKDKNNFCPLTNEESLEVSFARNILCFLFIAEQSRIALGSNNYSIGPPSADVFDMIFQNFTPGTEDIAVKSGSMTSGGWTLNEIHFQEPWSTGGFFKNIHKNIYGGINSLLLSKKDDEIKNRILRSMEWYRLAHIENESISQFFKVVMIATAFEIIFDIPNQPDKAGFLADKIDQTVARTGHSQATRVYGKDGSKSKTRSIAAWWGWDFYKLRNSVVHGDALSSKDLIYFDWITHSIVADMLFYSYIAYILHEAGYISSEYEKPDFQAVFKILRWM